MNTQTNIPKDGYYSAVVYHDTGGTMRRAVQVHQGKVLDSRGQELLLEACSEFKEMERMHAVEVWPEAHAALIDHLEGEVLRLTRVIDSDSWIPAACFGLLAEHGVPIGSPELLAAKDQVEAEMQTLRTANAGLMEKLRELEEENRSVYNLMLSGERRGIEKATQELQPQLHALKASVAEVEQLREQVKRLEAAGDEMAAWLRNPRNLGDDPFMADQWEATKGQP